VNLWWLCTLGVMIDPGAPQPHGWFAVESPAPFLVGHPHDPIDPLWYDADRGLWRMTGTTWGAVPVILAPGQAACLWFAGDLEGPRLCLDPGWSRADADLSDRVDSRDISAFVGLWVSGPRGDFNADLHTDSADLSAFLSAWLEGVQ
jgi:hypothetical protein